MSTLYVLSLRSEEDLVDIEGWVSLGSMGWMWWLGQTKARGAAAVGLLTTAVKPVKCIMCPSLKLFAARSEEQKKRKRADGWLLTITRGLSECYLGASSAALKQQSPSTELWGWTRL